MGNIPLWSYAKRDEWGNGVMQNVMSGEMCAVSLVGLCEIKNVDVLSLITA